VKVDILGVQIDQVSMEQAVAKTQAFFEGGVHVVYTPNPEIIMEAQKNENLQAALNRADLLLPDGIGVVIASKIMGTPLSERVPGFDYVCELLKLDKSFYLFGGKPGVAEMAAKELKAKGVNVVGYHHGYFQEDGDIIEEINRLRPDILLVCLGAPKQELWIDRNRDGLNTHLCIGAGGTLDVLAGNVKRAPELFQKLYLEWLYRALKQPSRLPRLLKLPQFLFKVMLLKGGKKA
jgi:N-acetylglucosaminyldiphosphoundecaprenol N-acetyl-beta-D-mannosaminyltransferase